MADLPDIGPRYRLLRRIAQGGSSAVFEAQDLDRGKRCAVKLMRVGDPSPALIERFRREVAMADRLQGHPGIVAPYDAGSTPQGDLYCTLDYVEGDTLEDRIHDPALSLADKVHLLLEVARSVEFAHGRELIHRDLKPANVLVTALGQARLSDFGISKALDEGLGLTATGDQLGTPCYMAPEQIEDSKRVDERTDVYGMGAILYETLTAYRPFEGESVLAIMHRVVHETPRPPREIEPTADPVLSGLAIRALSKDPALRPPTARAFAEELAAWLEAQSRPGGVDPQQGRVVGGRFELLERIGRGGYAVVYRARTLEAQEVALKLFDPRFGQTAGGRARFLREVDAMRAFKHPRAVRVHAFGEEDDGSLYLAMDLVPGETLAARLRRTPHLPLKLALAVADQALDVLAAAHEARLVHRDLKPANLMLHEDDDGPQVVVLDFGIAKAISDLTEARDEGITQTGAAPGTPRYMSPEQAAGDPVDARSDLYSLATVLYECLAGRPPLLADSTQRFLWKLGTEAAPPVRRFAPDVPPQAAEAIQAALAKERHDRPRDARTFQALLRGEEPPAPPPDDVPVERLEPERAPSHGIPGALPSPRPVAVHVAARTSEGSDSLPSPRPVQVQASARMGKASSDSLPSPRPVQVQASARMGKASSDSLPSPRSVPVQASALVGKEASDALPSPKPVKISTPAQGHERDDDNPFDVLLGQGQEDKGSGWTALLWVLALLGAAAAAVFVLQGCDVPPSSASPSPSAVASHPTGAPSALIEPRPATSPEPPAPPDTASPILELLEPADGFQTDVARVQVVGRVQDDDDLVVVLVGDQSATVQPAVGGGREFRAWHALELGPCQVVVTARDAAGNQTRLTVDVERVAAPEDDGPSLPPGVVRGPEGELLAERDGAALVYVPAATFRLGRSDGPKNEGPVHEVRFTRGIYMAEREVTWAQYRAFAAATGREVPNPEIRRGDELLGEAQDTWPVFGVSWKDAQAYSRWAGGRLPTEAEWEYTAGFGRQAYPWGDGPAAANLLGGDDGHALLAPSGSFPGGASPFGALDLAGNVAEWVLDRWSAPYDEYDAEDPRGPQRGERRVLRGGSWRAPLDDARVTARAPALIDHRADDAGFRFCIPDR